jgi:protein-tyrosine phosphatase
LKNGSILRGVIEAGARFGTPALEYHTVVMKRGVSPMRTKLYWITGPWSGRLAVTPRPRGGDWLEDEIHSWRRSGVGGVVSLLTSDEVGDLDLATEAGLCGADEIKFFSFPIEDRHVPSSKEAFSDLVTKLDGMLSEGKNVAVHCRQGIGRAALVAVCLLIQSGMATEAAIERVSIARGCPVPETDEQRRWITAFARSSTKGSNAYRSAH